LAGVLEAGALKALWLAIASGTVSPVGWRKPAQPIGAGLKGQAAVICDGYDTPTLICMEITAVDCA